MVDGKDAQNFVNIVSEIRAEMPANVLTNG